MLEDWESEQYESADPYDRMPFGDLMRARDRELDEDAAAGEYDEPEPPVNPWEALSDEDLATIHSWADVADGEYGLSQAEANLRRDIRDEVIRRMPVQPVSTYQQPVGDCWHGRPRGTYCTECPGEVAR